MVRVLHLSDVHLGASFDNFGERAEARRQEVLDAFRGLAQVAEQEGVHAVLLAGDLFDSPTPTDYTLSVVRQTLRRLVDAGRPVFVIPGNHDAITCNPELYAEPFGGAVLFTTPTFEAPVSVETDGGPLHIYGLGYDWARPEPLGSFDRWEAPGVHVVLVHGCMPGTANWRWYPNALRITPAWLEGVSADYVALGDSHVFRAPDAFEGGRACYPGSFAAVDMSYPGPRGWVIADLEPGALPQVRHEASSVRSAFDVGELDVAGYVDEEAVAAAIAARVPANALPVVTLTGELSFPLQLERMQLVLEQRYASASVTDRSWYAGSTRLDELGERDTIAGHVVRLGRDRLEQVPEGADDDESELAQRAMRLALRALRVEG